MTDIRKVFAMAAVAMALSAPTWADGVEAPAVGTSWGTKCTGNNAAERTWKVVRNDGEAVRIEAEDGSFAEAPIWGWAMGFNTSNDFGSGKFLNEPEDDDLKKVATLEVGKSFAGYVRQTGPAGTNQHRYDVSIKERAQRETPFGPVEAVKVVTTYGNNFWNATRTVWYAPELKLALSNDFESNRGQKSNCQVTTRPQ